MLTSPPLDEASSAATVARQMVTQVTALNARMQQLLANGQPANAQQGLAAVTGADLVTALGPANLAVFTALNTSVTT